MCSYALLLPRFRPRDEVYVSGIWLYVLALFDFCLGYCDSLLHWPYKGWLICGEFAKDNSFCKENVQRLKDISKLALLECILYLVAMIILLVLNLLHPSVLLMTLFIIFVGISIAVVAATLSHLVEKARELKEENDLTI